MVNRDENHVYRNKDGLIYISNTQHLAIAGWSDFSMVDGETLEYACQRGTYTHDALNMHVDDDLDLESLEGQPYKPYVEAGIAFLEQTGFIPHETNKIVWSDLLRTAGELDMIGNFPGESKTTILDWKTGSPSPTTAIQLAGYNLMNCKGNPFFVENKEVNLKGNGKYKIIAHDRKKHNSTFEQMCRLNWKALSMGIVPVGAKNDPQIYELCKTIIKEG